MKYLCTRFFVLALVAVMTCRGSLAQEDPFEPTVTRAEAKLLENVMSVATDDLAEATRMLSEMDLVDASPALDFALGNLAYQGEQLDIAEAAYGAALRKMPRFRRALNNLGRVYLLQERPADAIAQFQSLLRDGQADGAMLILLGHALLMEQKPVSADGAYRQALLLQPESADARRGLIKSLIEQSRYPEALALVREALRTDPGDRELWSLRANIELALNDTAAVMTTIETAQRLNVAGGALLATLGDLYLNRDQPADARAAYAAALASGEIPTARTLRAAEAFLATGDADTCAELLARTAADAAEDERDRRTHLRLTARLAQARGQADVAATQYGRLVALDPLNGEALLALAALRAEAGRVEEARMLLERAARVRGFEARAQWRHAQLEVDQGRYAAAVRLLKSAQTFDPRPHVAHYLEQVQRLVQE